MDRGSGWAGFSRISDRRGKLSDARIVRGHQLWRSGMWRNGGERDSCWHSSGHLPSFLHLFLQVLGWPRACSGAHSWFPFPVPIPCLLCRDPEARNHRGWDSLWGSPSPTLTRRPHAQPVSPRTTLGHPGTLPEAVTSPAPWAGYPRAAATGRVCLCLFCLCVCGCLCVMG